MFETAHDGWMGGSGGRRGAERSLQGLRQSGLLVPPVEGDVPDATAERRPGGRHCWLTDAPGLPGRWPGLVVEWRRHGGRWQGRVLVVVLEGQDTRVICGWFEQTFLTPVVAG
jgi:hypothetical protein